ncbi:hypothetical protein TWF481_007262 [Arthrobotrys musiformis]|uniref:Uncharacterized protein n=1 Tax=Arthrobotrys musiformis TaxID=47236 RepID=A0AAV9WB16_9PEZI
MFPSGLRRMPPWSSVIPDLSSSALLGCKESHHLVNASLHLPSDDVCFIFLTSEDVATEDLEAQVIARIRLCENLAKSRGVVYLRTQEDGHTFYTLSNTSASPSLSISSPELHPAGYWSVREAKNYHIYSLQQNSHDSATSQPFILPLSKVQDLVPVLESFIRDFRAQKTAQIERMAKLHDARRLRVLNLLGEAVTHTKIDEHAVYAISNSFSSMLAYSEACIDPRGQERLSAVLAMGDSKGNRRRMVDSIVGFWQQNEAS